MKREIERGRKKAGWHNIVNIWRCESTTTRETQED